MVLSIADWILKIECRSLAIEALPNWKPFLMPDEADEVAGEESLLAVLQTEVGLPACGGSPTTTARPDGRLLCIWLLPGCCCLELAVPEKGIRCRLRADRNWRHVQTDWGLNGVSDYDLLNDLLMLTFIYASAFRHTVLVHASCVVTNDAGVARPVRHWEKHSFPFVAKAYSRYPFVERRPTCIAPVPMGRGACIWFSLEW